MNFTVFIFGGYAAASVCVMAFLTLQYRRVWRAGRWTRDDCYWATGIYAVLAGFTAGCIAAAIRYWE